MARNTFSNLKRKIFKLWKDNKDNTLEIITQTDDNSIIVNGLKSANSKSLIFNKILNLTTSWQVPDVDESSLIDGFPPSTIYKTWSAVVQGLPLKFLGVLTHSFNVRFGTGEELDVDEDIKVDETEIRTFNYVETNQLQTEDEDTSNNIFTYYYGIKLSDSNDLQEFQNGIQVRLNLRMLHPNLYY